MKLHNIIYILLCSVVVAMFACTSSSTTTYTPSDDPTVATLTLSNDSFPALKKAVFTIDERIDTGLIYNVDSITYGTRIDSAVVSFTFNASAISAAIIFTPTDTISLSGKDTINFTQRPVYLHTISETGTADKWYEIQVNVHQTDPDLFQWELLAENIISAEYSNQKAVIMRDTIYLLASNGLKTQVLYSADGTTFTSISAPFSDFDVQNTLVLAGKIYCLNQEEVATLSSASGTWERQTIDTSLPLTINRLLLTFCYSSNQIEEAQDSIWAIATEKSSEQLCLATTADLSTWTQHDYLPADFPTSDFAAVPFFSPTGRPRAMFVGGFSAEGASLNTRWNVEYELGQGYRWENFTIEQPTFESLTGASIIYYNKHFLMFGGANADNQVDTDANILESWDEGMNWSPSDTTHNRMPDTYINRAYQSVLIDSKNNVYVIGGKSRDQVFTDVYKGRLNSINW